MTNQRGNSTVAVLRELYMNRNVRFLLFNLLFVIVFFIPIRDLMEISWNSDYYTYIPFIPFISAYLIYENKRAIFSEIDNTVAVGIIVLGSGLLLELIRKSATHMIASQYQSMVNALAMVMFWSGGFAICYGSKALRRAIFPVLFLIFTIPISDAVLDRIIVFLQKGSAEISYAFIQATGMPISREGFIFHLPTMDIEIAKQCSGIRSSLSLVIIGTLAAHFFLRTMWAKTIFILLIVPIAIIKNGIRITTFALLGVYWDEKILASDLHQRGGIIFFFIALLIVGMLMMLLKQLEKSLSKGAARKSPDEREVTT